MDNRSIDLRIALNRVQAAEEALESITENPHAELAAEMLIQVRKTLSKALALEKQKRQESSR